MQEETWEVDYSNFISLSQEMYDKVEYINNKVKTIG